jgi:GNAT superfamily N-acetyltransferase
MSEPHIRQLTLDDLDDALALSSTAGWNQRLDDWRVLLRIAPHGCVAAWSGDRVIGTAIGIDYGGFGWIAMMLVDPACRGRGLGRRLLEAAMAAIPPDRPIRLDATPLGRPLYLSAGFEDETAITRLVRPAGARGVGRPSETRPEIRPMTPADLLRVAGCDAVVFGGHRQPVLEWALETAPAYAWIQDGDPPQYCFGRMGRVFNQVGPVVTSDDATAWALVGVALRAASDIALTVDAVDAYPAFAGWLRESGFDAQRPLFRMRRPPAQPSAGEVPRPPAGLAERAILGPEFA